MDIKPNLKLKMLLLQNGMTQRQLAFGANIDESRISKIIKGYEIPTSEMKEEISEFLGVSVNECF